MADSGQPAGEENVQSPASAKTKGLDSVADGNAPISTPKSTAGVAASLLAEVDAQRAAAAQHENALLHTVIKALCDRIDTIEARVDASEGHIMERLEAAEHVTHSMEEIEHALQSDLE